MKRTQTFLAIPAIVLSIALLTAACGDSENLTPVADGGDSAAVVTAVPDTSPSSTVAEPISGSGDDPIELNPGDPVAEGEQQFVGLDVEAAATLADSQGRPWRIGRQDGEFLVLTDDYNVGRVTFEVDNDVVSSATIEVALDGLEPVAPKTTTGATEAGLISAAIIKMITEDNSFGGGDPFDTVYVANVVSSGSRAVDPAALERVETALQSQASVEFIDDSEDKINELINSEERVAVVSVDDVRIDGSTAEIEMSLWCGLLCGLWFTYEAEIADGVWQILGTIGPVAIA